MTLPPFPDEYIPTSPEARLRLIAWGEECARAYKDDAERYRWLRYYTGAGRSMPGSPVAFRLPTVPTVKGVNLLKGSVAQHLDAAIDAARTDEGLATSEMRALYEQRAADAGVWAKQYDDGTWAACRGGEVITPPTYPTAEAALAAAGVFAPPPPSQERE